MTPPKSRASVEGKLRGPVLLKWARLLLDDRDERVRRERGEPRGRQRRRRPSAWDVLSVWHVPLLHFARQMTSPSSTAGCARTAWASSSASWGHYPNTCLLRATSWQQWP